MRSPAMVVAGVVVALLGLLFMFQGLGVDQGQLDDELRTSGRWRAR